jgi:hypothetical protein
MCREYPYKSLVQGLKEIKTHKGPKNENMGNIGQPLE